MAAETRTQRRPWVPLLIVALLGSLVFTVLSHEFATSFNIYVILSHAALLCLIGFSQMTVLSVGEFSLAVGGIGEIVGVVAGYLMVTRGVPLLPAITAGLACGTACGLLNGVLVTKSRISGFVVTLATGGVFTGLAVAITQTSSYTGLPAALNEFGAGRVGFFPYAGSATLVVAAALGVLYHWRRSGRLMLAVGGNPEAAELSGLSRARGVILAHTLSGLLAGVAGLTAMAQLHEANPLAATDWLLQSFTIPIIGGTSLAGGSVSIVGLLVAGLILATIGDGLILVRVNPYWVTLVEGVIVFLAVLLGRAQSWRTYGLLFSRRATPQGSLPP